jgi:hypothetical protein
VWSGRNLPFFLISLKKAGHEISVHANRCSSQVPLAEYKAGSSLAEDKNN